MFPNVLPFVLLTLIYSGDHCWFRGKNHNIWTEDKTRQDKQPNKHAYIPRRAYRAKRTLYYHVGLHNGLATQALSLLWSSHKTTQKFSSQNREKGSQSAAAEAQPDPRPTHQASVSENAARMEKKIGWLACWLIGLATIIHHFGNDPFSPSNTRISFSSILTRTQLDSPSQIAASMVHSHDLPLQSKSTRPNQTLIIHMINPFIKLVLCPPPPPQRFINQPMCLPN